jgi:isopenicillin N synthase-like dioxygenase
MAPYFPVCGDKYPLASLQTIRLSTILHGDSCEKLRLLGVCQSDGFFYLDVNDYEDLFAEDVTVVCKTAKDFFDLPNDVKSLYSHRPQDSM